ncbi:MAG: adenylosuccinate synthetase, partial [Oligoflexia bacterium]|nr:adenylosuccinate synthetase [Oligoflexia bacterium]
MPALIVIGSQWGDEGKGKLIDILSSKADFVVRYQGGANAGHTLKVQNEQIIVHLIPSAVFHPQV